MYVTCRKLKHHAPIYGSITQIAEMRSIVLFQNFVILAFMYVLCSLVLEGKIDVGYGRRVASSFVSESVGKRPILFARLLRKI